jgi:hypothetical protein
MKYDLAIFGGAKYPELGLVDLKTALHWIFERCLFNRP